MPTFCLIHSSVQGSDGWGLLVEALNRRGYRSITPDFGMVDPTGLAAAFAAIAVDIIRAELEPEEDQLWLLAHSAGGLFLPWIAANLPDLPVKGLIYLAAYVPFAGTSLLDSLAADQAMFHPEWIGADPMDDAAAIRFLFHDCPAPSLDWALSTRRLTVASSAMAESLPATLGKNERCEYIVCRDDRTLTPQWMRKAAKQRLGRTPIEIDGGHCPHVARPEALAAILTSITSIEH